MHTLLPLLLLLATISTAATIPGKPPPALEHRTPAPAPAAAKKQTGGRKADEEHQTKYFHEAGGSLELGHYDARYFRGEVPYEAHVPALRHLIRSWLATARELDVETWLAHGTLLGWWWNGRVMPWDYDLDVQMPTATLTYLGRHFNRTLHDFWFLDEDGVSGPGSGTGAGSLNTISTRSSAERRAEAEVGASYVNKTYLLDVNPHHTDVGRGNGQNVIDARWIDVSNGLFIDITGLAERDAATQPGVWSCKNAHRYRTTDLYPVRRTEFEGVPAGIPYAFDKILTDEYGPKSLVSTEWAGHRWVPELKEWIKNTKEPDEEAGLNKQQDSKAVVVVVEKTVMKGGSKK
ncbi:LicD family-domain-containing protein [Hypoxylon sp. NC1633]|nr:LicD family-domain-containing protein [Hypoxylon sp. NC1633]